MKFKLPATLFWFLKKNAEVDLATPAGRDAYVQQVITRGKTSDVKTLLKTIRTPQLKESINRLSRFLPREVRMFWEDYLGSPHPSAKRTA